MKRIAFVLFLVFLWAASANGGTTGKIAGRVIDSETGDPLPGANVFIESIWFGDVEIEMDEKMGAATDVEGDYFIINIPPGVYSLQVKMIGYKNTLVQRVQVLVDKTVTMDFTLEEEVIAGEEIIVTADKKMIQRDLTSTSANISTGVINSLPVESFQDVVELQAGVVDGHFRGGRKGEVVYMMNGISINDAFSGEAAFEVENNVIEQLEVISGTFNAEYGQAMSGVVNIVTKEGSDDYRFTVDVHAGDYYTTDDDIFWDQDRLNPGNSYNVETSFSGPLAPKLKFLTSFRFNRDQGAIWGKERFTPGDSSDFSSDAPEEWHIGASGDGDYHPMNDDTQLTGHGKLSYRLTNNTRISLEGLWQMRDYHTYNHLFRLNPDGDVDRFRRGLVYTLMMNHTFNANLFMDVKLASFRVNQYYRAFEDWDDERYQPEDKLRIISGPAFYVCGSDNAREDRTTSTMVGKLEFTWQCDKIHQLKSGVEFRSNRLEYEYMEPVISAETGWEPALPDRKSPLNNVYTHKPKEISGYIQDKMEFKEVIVNAGLRFDYFDPAGHTPSDMGFPDTSPLENSEVKTQLSPRLGIAYPISDNGVLHVSYGHFFQVPNYSYLYENSEFEVAVRSFPVMGNSDLNPQKTTTYEFGLQQQVGSDFALDLTAYYKDIRDLIATEILEKKDTYDKYARYVNKDYGMVKGITLALEKRQSQGWGGAVDYTYQVAKGNASDPKTVWMNNQKDPPVESEKKMVPLNWDRRHSLNFSLFLGNMKDYNVSFIAKFGSGLPYTPAYQNQRTASENSARKPAFYDFSVYAYRYFSIGRSRLSLFFKIYNLFDRRNELNVYSDTGRAGYTLAPESMGIVRGANNADQYYARPDFYSSPRRILVGIGFRY